jgi:hypothetical protein
MHSLPSVYWATTVLHVSGLLVVHHQEVAMYILVCDNWYCTCCMSLSTVGGPGLNWMERVPSGFYFFFSTTAIQYQGLYSMHRTRDSSSCKSSM